MIGVAAACLRAARVREHRLVDRPVLDHGIGEEELHDLRGDAVIGSVDTPGLGCDVPLRKDGGTTSFNRWTNPGG